MATETVTSTTLGERQEASQPAYPAPAAQPESYELSFRAPGRSLKELSRRFGNEARRRSAEMMRPVEGEGITDGDAPGTVPPPATAVKKLETWSKPRGNTIRLVFCFWAFIIAGMNDAAVGVGCANATTALCHLLTSQPRPSSLTSKPTMTSLTPLSP